VRKVLADTCVYSNFALIGRFDVLERLYGRDLAITRLVVAEIARGTSRLPGLGVGLEAVREGRLEVIDEIDPDELALMLNLPPKFSPADKTCIAVAVRRRWTLLTDEKAMLKECARRGAATLKTDDVLREAVRAGFLRTEDLSEIADVMERMANYRPAI